MTKTEVQRVVKEAETYHLRPDVRRYSYGSRGYAIVFTDTRYGERFAIHTVEAWAERKESLS